MQEIYIHISLSIGIVTNEEKHLSRKADIAFFTKPLDVVQFLLEIPRHQLKHSIFRR